MEWVSAREAIEALGGSPSEATDSNLARSIMQHAFEGRVAARAAEFQRVSGEYVDRETGAKIPSEFWTLTKGYAIEQDWIAGRFAAVVIPPGMRVSEKWRGYGVQFCKADLQALGGRFDSGRTDASEVQSGLGRTRGGAPLSKRWPEFISELCLWVYEGNDFAGMTAAKLIETINTRLSKRGVQEIPPGTAYDAAKSVLSVLGRASTEIH